MRQNFCEIVNALPLLFWCFWSEHHYCLECQDYQINTKWWAIFYNNNKFNNIIMWPDAFLGLQKWFLLYPDEENFVFSKYIDEHFPLNYLWMDGWTERPLIFHWATFDIKKLCNSKLSFYINNLIIADIPVQPKLFPFTISCNLTHPVEKIKKLSFTSCPRNYHVLKCDEYRSIFRINWSFLIAINSLRTCVLNDIDPYLEFLPNSDL